MFGTVVVYGSTYTIYQCQKVAPSFACALLSRVSLGSPTWYRHRFCSPYSSGVASISPDPGGAGQKRKWLQMLPRTADPRRAPTPRSDSIPFADLRRPCSLRGHCSYNLQILQQGSVLQQRGPGSWWWCSVQYGNPQVSG